MSEAEKAEKPPGCQKACQFNRQDCCCYSLVLACYATAAVLWLIVNCKRVYVCVYDLMQNVVALECID